MFYAAHLPGTPDRVSSINSEQKLFEILINGLRASNNKLFNYLFL